MPGRTGIICSETETEKSAKQSANTNKKPVNLTQLITSSYIESILNDNINHLLHKPTPEENQVIKLKEALGAFYYQDKMNERPTLSIEEDAQMRKSLELKAYTCPTSLIQGIKEFRF